MSKELLKEILDACDNPNASYHIPHELYCNAHRVLSEPDPQFVEDILEADMKRAEEELGHLDPSREWKGTLSRAQAIGIINSIVDREDPYWENHVEDYYDEDSDTMPSVYHVLAALGITEQEYKEATGADNANWPTGVPEGWRPVLLRDEDIDWRIKIPNPRNPVGDLRNFARAIEQAVLKVNGYRVGELGHLDAYQAVMEQRDEFKKDADALLELLKQSRMETEALKARIDGGVRVYAHPIPYLTGTGRAVGAESNHPEVMFNATVVLDSGVVL